MSGPVKQRDNETALAIVIALVLVASLVAVGVGFAIGFSGWVMALCGFMAGVSGSLIIGFVATRLKGY